MNRWMITAVMGAIALSLTIDSVPVYSNIVVSQTDAATTPVLTDEAAIAQAQAAIQAAQQAETPDQVTPHLVEADQFADAIQDPTRRQQVKAAIAIQYAALGMMEAAIARLDQLDYSTYSPENCCVPFRTEVERAIARAYAKAGQLDAALSFAETIEAEFSRNQVIAALIDQLVQTGDLDRAIALLDRIRNDEYYLASAQHTIIRGYITKGQILDGLAFSQTMANADERSGARFNLVQGAIRTGEYSIAQQIAQEISNPWSKLEALRITALAYAGIGNGDAARRLIDQGYAHLQEMPDNQAFSYWIRNYADIGAYDDAIRLAEQLSIRYDQAEAYIFIGQALVQHNQFEQAFNLAQRVEDGELQVLADYEDPKVLLLNDIVKQAAMDGKYEVAMQVARTYGQPEDRVEAFRVIAEQIRLIGNSAQAKLIMQEAFELAKTIERIGYHVDRHLYYETSNAALLMMIAEDFSTLNDSERAIAALDAAMQSAQAFEGDDYYDATERQLRLWLDMAKNYSQLQQADQVQSVLDLATDLARATEDAGLRGQRLAQIAKVYAQADRPAQAQALLLEALQIGTSISDGPQTLGVMSAIAEGYAILGDETQLQTIAQQFLQASQALPDPYQQSTILSQAAVAFSAAPDPTLAIQLANAITDEIQRAHTLSSIAANYRTSDRPQQAQTVIEQLMDSGDRTWDSVQRDSLISNLIVNQYANPYTTSPEWSYALAADLNTTVEDPKARASNAFAIAIGYARLGNMEQAQTTLNQGLEAIAQVDDLTARQNALWESFDQIMLANELDLAVSLARGFDNPRTRIAILRRLAQSYARNGDINQADVVMDLAVAEAEAIADIPSRMNLLDSIKDQRTDWLASLTYPIPL